MLRRVDTASQPFSNADMTQSVGCDNCFPPIGSENAVLLDYFSKKPVEVHLRNNPIFLEIINAYELKQTDVLAVESIIPTDKPFIPPGYENCDLVDILNHRKSAGKG